MTLDRSTLELRDPDTDSEPWPAYPEPRSGAVIVYLAVVLAVLLVLGVVVVGVKR